MAKKSYKAAISNPRGDRECILIVCPGSHEQQGRKFAATMDTINNSFRCHTLYLADELDVHNGRTPAEARQQGHDWLVRHADLIEGLPVVRWREVKGDPAFQTAYDEIGRLYMQTPPVRQAIDDICREHTHVLMERFRTQGRAGFPSDLMRQSVDYMLEEIAGLAVIRQRGDFPEVYPGACFEDPAIFDRFSPVPLALPRVLPVRFVQTPQFQASGFDQAAQRITPREPSVWAL